ncbi:7797_t:CDS:1, partial [Funneliformis mosseae]
NIKHNKREFSEEVYGVESSEKDENSKVNNIVSEISLKLIINQKVKNSLAKWIVIQKSILRNF